MRAFCIAFFVVQGCAHLTPAPAVECGSNAGEASAVLRSKQMLVLGDFHGSKEIPAFVASLTCDASKHGPMVLALEVPPSPGTLAYLDSDGSPEAKAIALSDAFWKRAFQDGRSSVAMFELFERVRQLRRAGRSVELSLFDVEADSKARDEAMAKQLIALRKAKPDASVLVLVGNLHARRTPGGLGTNTRWMSTYLAGAQISFVSLNAVRAEGTAWSCMGPNLCGPNFIESRLASEAVRPGQVVLGATDDGAYDGTYQPGATFTASPPAAYPELQAGFEAKVAAVMNDPARALRKKAMAAYERGDFPGCASSFAALTTPTGEDAYSEACCLARAGKKTEALNRLSWAIAHGVPVDAQLQADEDLAALHSDPRWPH